MELSAVFIGPLPVQYCMKMDSASVLKTKESKKAFMIDVCKKVVKETTDMVIGNRPLHFIKSIMSH